MFIKKADCRQRIGNIGGKITVSKITFTIAQSGKIKTQYRITMFCQYTTATVGNKNIPGAGKTVVKNNKGDGRGGREFQSTIKAVIIAAGKRDFYASDFVHLMTG